MPLTKRSIQPQSLCKVKVPHGLQDDLEFVANSSLTKIILQVSSLSLLAEDLFNELHRDTVVIFSRVENLVERVERMNIYVTQLDPMQEELEGVEIFQQQSTEPWRSGGNEVEQQLISRSNRPAALSLMYCHCQPIPALHLLDSYRDDERISSKFYTDPDEFLKHWINGMMISSQSNDQSSESSKSIDRQPVNGYHDTQQQESAPGLNTLSNDALLLSEELLLPGSNYDTLDCKLDHVTLQQQLGIQQQLGLSQQLYIQQKQLWPHRQIGLHKPGLQQQQQLSMQNQQQQGSYDHQHVSLQQQMRQNDTSSSISCTSTIQQTCKPSDIRIVQQQDTTANIHQLQSSDDAQMSPSCSFDLPPPPPNLTPNSDLDDVHVLPLPPSQTSIPPPPPQLLHNYGASFTARYTLQQTTSTAEPTSVPNSVASVTANTAASAYPLNKTSPEEFVTATGTASRRADHMNGQRGVGLDKRAVTFDRDNRSQLLNATRRGNQLRQVHQQNHSRYQQQLSAGHPILTAQHLSGGHESPTAQQQLDAAVLHAFDVQSVMEAAFEKRRRAMEEGSEGLVEESVYGGGEGQGDFNWSDEEL